MTAVTYRYDRRLAWVPANTIELQLTKSSHSRHISMGEEAKKKGKKREGQGRHKKRGKAEKMMDEKGEGRERKVDERGGGRRNL